MVTRSSRTCGHHSPDPQKAMAKQGGPGKPFQPGNHFGRGRPRGSRNKSKLPLVVLLQTEGEAIVRKAIDLAKAGEPTALKLCMERLVSPCKEHTFGLALPADVTTPTGILAAFGAVASALARGEITPSETLATTRILDSCRQAIETQELDRRLSALERSAIQDPSSGTTRSPADEPGCSPNTAERGSRNQAVSGGTEVKES